ncbi:MAG: glycosyltransferase family 2 protein [Lautropia sp.]|nr:glycosyltransferase family 2 protein [Lautropia sp.]
MKTIALTMIVKNEERSLARCLQSVRPWVDQMIVLDTGSTDQTMAIARAEGAEVHQRRWTHDFSAARNAALALSQADWNLILDADEWLISGGEYLHDLRKAAQPAVHYVRLQNQLSEDDPSLVDHGMITRILPRGVRYQGRIHEQPVHKLPTLMSSLVIGHDGYQPAQRATKATRNLDLLMAEVQAHPDDAYYQYQLGKEHDSLQHPQQALTHYQRAYQLDRTHPAWRHDLIIRMLECLKRSEQLAQAIELASMELEHWQHSPDFHYVAATLMAEQLKQHPQQQAEYLPLVEALCLQALQLGDVPTLTGAVSGRGSFLAAHLLWETYERLGKTEEAREAQSLCEALYLKQRQQASMSQTAI